MRSIGLWGSSRLLSSDHGSSRTHTFPRSFVCWNSHYSSFRSTFLACNNYHSRQSVHELVSFCLFHKYIKAAVSLARRTSAKAVCKVSRLRSYREYSCFKSWSRTQLAVLSVFGFSILQLNERFFVFDSQFSGFASLIHFLKACLKLSLGKTASSFYDRS